MSNGFNRRRSSAHAELTGASKWDCECDFHTLLPVTSSQEIAGGIRVVTSMNSITCTWTQKAL